MPKQKNNLDFPLATVPSNRGHPVRLDLQQVNDHIRHDSMFSKCSNMFGREGTDGMMGMVLEGEGCVGSDLMRLPNSGGMVSP